MGEENGYFTSVLWLLMNMISGNLADVFKILLGTPNNHLSTFNLIVLAQAIFWEHGANG